MNSCTWPAFLWQNLSQNHFGNPNRLKSHIKGCKWWIFYSNMNFKRFGCPKSPKWFWQKLCHKKAVQIEPFLS